MKHDHDVDWWTPKIAPKLRYFCDKYAWRYINILKYRVTAYKYYLSSHKYSDTVVFWYEDFASKEDAILAAKLWTLNGELERCPKSTPTDVAPKLPDGVYKQPDPMVESTGSL